MTVTNSEPERRSHRIGPFLAFSTLAAAVAASAAYASLFVGFAPWAMFVGWVAYFTRPVSLRQGLFTLASLVGGLVFGLAAVLSVAALNPALGPFALVLVVFVVASLVVSMRAVPVLNNILAWFLGLIAFFAAHMEPSLTSVVELAGAGTLGSAAAWTSQQLQRQLVTKRRA